MATTLTPATSISSSSGVKSAPIGDDRHNIMTELNYWKQLEHASVSVDFTAPDGQERFSQLSKLNQAHNVLIQDIRGEESEYTLEQQGFQYVQHKITGLKDWSNKDEVTAVLIPATEQLVKEM
jgi:hypothetical protein